MATVAEVLTAATDSVTLINDINTNGKKSTYVGGTAEARYNNYDTSRDKF